MTQVAYDLAAFTQDLDRIAAEEATSYRALVQRARPLLERLIADASWIDAQYTQPRGAGSTQYLLHRAPGAEYTVTSTVFPAGYGTTIHDHTTWGLIGVWRGEEHEERFVREDDGSTGRASLRAVGTVLNNPGSVTWLIPPDEEIHRIRNVSPFPSVSVHVYGADLNGRARHQFDLETGEIKEFRSSMVII
jgi:3-mercaptopropionate dioxygenase